MRSFPRTLHLFPALLLAASALLLAGCAGQDDAPDEPVAGDSPAATEPATPTESPTSETPTPTPSPSPATLTDRLLPTASVPGLNARWTWQDGRTGPATERPSDLCAKVGLIDIGATEAVQRSYFPPDDSDDFATQRIAEFPDAKTAATAWAVLGSWRAQCSTRPGGQKAGAFTAVQVPGGQARWYLVTKPMPGEDTGRFSAIGMVRQGTRITLLNIANSGQDYDYPAGQEPMVGMIQAAAERLG